MVRCVVTEAGGRWWDVTKYVKWSAINDGRDGQDFHGSAILTKFPVSKRV